MARRRCWGHDFVRDLDINSFFDDIDWELLMRAVRRDYPDVQFERYADDALCHCRSEAQAQELRLALEKRLAECRVRLHPGKTKIVSCKDANRKGLFLERAFDFLGFTHSGRD